MFEITDTLIRTFRKYHIPMSRPDAELLQRMIRAGRGGEPADLVLKNAALLDVITGTTTTTDIAIVADRIVGTHATYSGKTEIDVTGLTAVPGFIDTHLHIESSLVTPFEFDRCVLPHGVTTIVCDPHEIANVLGAEGIRYFVESAEHTIMDVHVNLSSCVPATNFETSGARLEIEDLLPFRDRPKVIGLAEVMNFPGVINTDPGIIAKLEAFQGGHMDGHAPLLRGTDLNAYLAAGIRTDHEATTAEEAREKLAKGMFILMREGSVSKDLDALAEILDENTANYVALCTDDRNPLDIGEEGHLDALIRRLIAKGVAPHLVYRVASHTAARIFGLMDRGLIAPGWRADMALLSNVNSCQVEMVISGGRLVTPELFAARHTIPPVGLDSMKAKPVAPSDFITEPKPNQNAVPVIGVKPGLIITFREEAVLASTAEGLQPDLDKDVIKVAVVERHGINGNIGRAFVKGFGLKSGAIASSIGHDSHNITVIGASDTAMARAVNHIIEMGGGFCVATDDEVRADLPLPIAGLMSLEPFEVVEKHLESLRSEAHKLGCILPEPFLQVAFLALPVIPHLKMTDRGLFDVDKFDFI
ncbi:MAG: adenine deaminase [Hyphomicrobiaceae bacterium]|nr:adenine deaminase [Hyphomicrobiaceae bacterium]MCC0023331.1 adenine deaminase [Hyphomicrobiaceae bacterium]